MSARKTVSEEYPDHLFALLELAQRRLTALVGQVAAGNAPELATIRPRYLRALQLIPPGGCRVSDLAERTATTKQAAGQLVAAMEERGLVSVAVDPVDARVRRVRRTRRGDQVDRRVTAVVAQAEQRLRAELGERSYDAMRRALQRIVTDSD